MENLHSKSELTELDNKPSTSGIRAESEQSELDCKSIIKKDHNELKYFECALCNLREKFEYFGKEPPFLNNYTLLEDAYIIEDPFLPPKQGKILILGSHCSKCNKMVCKDSICSIYFNSTYCINCAKNCTSIFPKAIQEKLNRIVI